MVIVYYTLKMKWYDGICCIAKFYIILNKVIYTDGHACAKLTQPKIYLQKKKKMKM